MIYFMNFKQEIYVEKVNKIGKNWGILSIAYSKLDKYAMFIDGIDCKNS